MNLIQYVASYGDLLSPAEPEAKHSSTTQRTKVSSDTDTSQWDVLTAGSYVLSLNDHFDRRSFLPGPHLRPRCLLRLSSRCCRT